MIPFCSSSVFNGTILTVDGVTLVNVPAIVVSLSSTVLPAILLLVILALTEKYANVAPIIATIKVATPITP